MEIRRSSGDTSPVRLTWAEKDGDKSPRLDDVTAISMQVYDTQTKTTFIETLTGEVRGFDPATWFPILDADWIGSRYFQIVLTRGSEVKPMPDLFEWRQT